MSRLPTIRQRLSRLQSERNSEITDAIIALLKKQKYRGRLSPENVMQLCARFTLTPVQLGLYCVPVAACYAITPVSRFNVGAVAIDQDGTFYFGANQEFASVAMQQTVHAEQSAVSHAWIAGAARLTDVVVNYTPCGHCRQFMNELNTAQTLKIHLPHSQNNLLQSYLPDSFGPKDLAIEKRYFDPQEQYFKLQGDELTRAAIQAAGISYAPYSEAFSGVALQTEENIVTGRYAENAAFNPTFLPLQSAFNYLHLQGLSDLKVSRIVLAEKASIVSSKAMTEALAKELWHIKEVEYIRL